MSTYAEQLLENILPFADAEAARATGGVTYQAYARNSLYVRSDCRLMYMDFELGDPVEYREGFALAALADGFEALVDPVEKGPGWVRVIWQPDVEPEE